MAGVASDNFADPTPTLPRKPFSSFKALSFDIYGTLIDWEKGITDAIRPLLSRLPSSSSLDTDALGTIFTKHENALEVAHPTMLYHDLLEKAYLATAEELGVSDDGSGELGKEARKFGSSIGGWPAFPDTIEAIKRLAKRYKLVALSNTSHKLFDGTKSEAFRGELKFDGEWLAEDIGTYKPSLKNYNYLIEHAKEEWGIEKEEILVVANSLHHDHVPAKELGFSSVWVNRGGVMGGDIEKLCRDGKVGYGWRVRTLKELADLMDEEEAQTSKK